MNVLDKRDKTLAPTPGGLPADKIEKFNWARPTTTGEFRLINKNLLNLDDRYQRDTVSDAKIKRIASRWDWVLFGTLKVAERPDKALWVVEGGHRCRASFYRSDIIELPCMVYPFAELKDEARAFIAGAMLTTHISSIDSFRACVAAEEPVAAKVRELLAEFGVVASKNAHGAKQIKCVNTLMQSMKEDAESTRSVFAVCFRIANDSPIKAQVFRAIFCLCRHFHPKDILAECNDKIESLSQQEIDICINRFKTECGRGGDVIGAKALMNLLNKGKKTKKLTW